MTLAGLLIAAWLLLVPWAVESSVRTVLAQEGVSVEDMRVTRLWLDGATVRDVRLGAPRAEISRIGIDWTVGQVWRDGTVDRLAISGIRLPATVGRSGAVSIGDLGLAPLIERFSIEPDEGAGEGAADTGGSASLPFEDLAIDDVAIRVDTYWRAFLIPARVDVAVADDGSVDGSIALTIDSEGQQLTASVQGTWSPTGAANGQLTFSGSPVGYGEILLNDASGWATLAVEAGSNIALDGWVGAGDLRVRGQSLGSVELLYQGDPLPRTVFARLHDAAGNALAVDVTGDGSAGWRIDAALEADALEALLGDMPSALGVPALAGELTATTNARLPARALDDALDGVLPDIGSLPIAIDARNMAWPGVVGGLDVQGQIDLALMPGAVVLSSDQTLRMSGTVTAIGQDGQVDIDPLDRPWRLRLPTGADPGFAFDGQVTVARPDGGSMTLAGAVAGDAVGIDLAGARLSGRDLTLGAWRLDAMELTLDGRAALTGLDLDLAGTIAGSGSLAGIVAGDVGADLGLRVTGPPLQPRLVGTTDCQALRFGRLDLDGVVLATPDVGGGAGPAAPTGWCLTSSNLEGGEDSRALLDWRDGTPWLSLAVQADGPVDVDIDGTATRLDSPRVEGQGGLADLAVALSASGAASADLGLALGDLTLAGRATVTEPWSVSAEVAAADLVLDGRPVVPVDIAGALSADAAAIGLQASASYRGLSFPVALTQDLAGTAGGGVTITIPGVRFRQDGLQPESLVPALAFDFVDWVDGVVSGQVSLGWNGDFSSAATIRISDMALSGNGFAAAGVNGRVRLYSLDPPRLADGQELTVGDLDFGPRLDDGTVVFGLGRGNVLSVQSARFQWAGGQVASEQFDYDLDGDAVDVVLTATGITLERLLEEFPVDGLSATGTLDGRIPISLRGATIGVEQGRLATRAPGIIRYRPGGGGDVGTGGDLDLFYDAVENFHYDSVVVTLSGTTGGDLTMGFDISGANPDLYDGYPIDLNINVSGALDQILRDGLEVMSIGDRAQDYFQNESTRGNLEGFWGNR